MVIVEGLAMNRIDGYSREELVMNRSDGYSRGVSDEQN